MNRVSVTNAVEKYGNPLVASRYGGEGIKLVPHVRGFGKQILPTDYITEHAVP